MKITPTDIKEGATFQCKMGVVKIVRVEKDGYSTGEDRVFASIEGFKLVEFINDNLKP